MKRITAILLAMLMVSFCFATTVMADETTEDATADITADITADVTSDDATSEDSTSEDATSEDELPFEVINVAAGKTYTITSDAEDGAPTFNGALDDGFGLGESMGLLTDGVVRDVEELTSAGAGVMDKSVELAGTNRTHFVTIDLGSVQDIGIVSLGTVRRGNNRYTNLVSVEALIGGVWTKINYEEIAVAIEGAGQYGSETIEAYDQFFDVYAVFEDLVDTTSIRVAIDTEDKTGAISHYGTRGYIAQLDEISVYSVIGLEDESGDNGTDTPTVPSTPSAGDLGLGVFAVLAVVSLAGVVVAKKVK